MTKTGRAGWGLPPLPDSNPSGPSQTKDILVFEDVVKIYNGRRVLDRVSFRVREGEHVSLTGESISGKTTIFKIIVGLVRPEEGRVKVFGQEITGNGGQHKTDPMSRVDMQFQSGALFDSMTVQENLMFVLNEKTDLPRQEKLQVVERLLRGVNLLSSKDKYPFELSGGMKKRVAVARALAATPRLALFDEPAAGLDPVTTARIVKLIKALVAEHPMTIMAATTDIHLAMNFGQRFILLKDGRVLADGPYQDLYSSEDPYIKKFLGRTHRREQPGEAVDRP